MKAAVIPAVNSRWEIRDIATPEPESEQVLIKMHASGMCYTDVHATKGELPLELSFPCTIGHEPVGEIVAIGEGVTTRRVGDRVGAPYLQSSCGRCEWCLRGKELFCADQMGLGGNMQGGHAEYMLAHADATMILPDDLEYEQAAPIFCAGYTVWSGLRWARPQPHERVAVVGIGGLGHLAVQYSKAAGFETIAVTRSRDKEKLARELGADEVFSDAEALEKAGGADVILATSNSMKSTSQAIHALRPDGRLMVIGYSAHEKLEVPSDILFTRKQVVGTQQNGVEYLYEALDYAAKGKVRVMTEEHKLDEVGRAYERVLNGEARFRVVLTM